MPSIFSPLEWSALPSDYTIPALGVQVGPQGGTWRDNEEKYTLSQVEIVSQSPIP